MFKNFFYKIKFLIHQKYILILINFVKIKMIHKNQNLKKKQKSNNKNKKMQLNKMKIFQKYKVRLMKQMKSKQKIQNQETLT